MFRATMMLNLDEDPILDAHIPGRKDGGSRVGGATAPNSKKRRPSGILPRVAGTRGWRTTFFSI